MAPLSPSPALEQAPRGLGSRWLPFQNSQARFGSQRCSASPERAGIGVVGGNACRQIRPFCLWKAPVNFSATKENFAHSSRNESINHLMITPIYIWVLKIRYLARLSLRLNSFSRASSPSPQENAQRFQQPRR